MIKFLLVLVIFGALAYYGFNFFNDNGVFGPLNNRLNSFINDKPKLTCVEDSDCHLTRPDCSPCGCGFAANKAWQPYCPFKDQKVFCSPCERFPEKENIKCINTECKIVY